MSPFPLLRLLNDQQFTSGVVLAERLGVSRANVSLALKQAGELGVEVQSLRTKGYRLGQPIEWLDELAGARELGTAVRFFRRAVRSPRGFPQHFFGAADLSKEAFIGTGVVCAVAVDLPRLAVYGFSLTGGRAAVSGLG